MSNFHAERVYGLLRITWNNDQKCFYMTYNKHDKKESVNAADEKIIKYVPSVENGSPVIKSKKLLSFSQDGRGNLLDVVCEN